MNTRVVGIGVLLALGLQQFYGECCAQQGWPQDCDECVIGIWEDPSLVTNVGRSEPNVQKQFYVGVKFTEEFPSLQGIEFSIAGMRFDVDGIVLVAVEELIPAVVGIGDLRAPADTSATSTGRGGITLAWSQPIVGDTAILRITILSLESLSNKLIQVKHHYPPTNVLWNTPVFIQPDGYFTPLRVSGGCYALNWDGESSAPCDIITAVKPTVWSEVKSLFR